MKKFEITKEQILEMTTWGNSRDKEKVKEWFPEAFKKELEVGKWYKSSCSIFFVTKIENENVYAYGLNDGEWLQDGCFNIKLSKNDTEATQQEVETALINQAKKRGLWDRQNITCLYARKESTCDNLTELFSTRDNSLWSKFGLVFQNGKWATIIDETLNNPVLSLNDLLSVWGDESEIELYKTSPLFKSFEKLAKSKTL